MHARKVDSRETSLARGETGKHSAFSDLFCSFGPIMFELLTRLASLKCTWAECRKTYLWKWKLICFFEDSLQFKSADVIFPREEWAINIRKITAQACRELLSMQDLERPDCSLQEAPLRISSQPASGFLKRSPPCHPIAIVDSASSTFTFHFPKLIRIASRQNSLRRCRPLWNERSKKTMEHWKARKNIRKPCLCLNLSFKDGALGCKRSEVS